VDRHAGIVRPVIALGRTSTTFRRRRRSQALLIMTRLLPVRRDMERGTIQGCHYRSRPRLQ
jgi:hypothetical protein